MRTLLHVGLACEGEGDGRRTVAVVRMLLRVDGGGHVRIDESRQHAPGVAAAGPTNCSC